MLENITRAEMKIWGSQRHSGYLFIAAKTQERGRKSKNYYTMACRKTKKNCKEKTKGEKE